MWNDSIFTNLKTHQKKKKKKNKLIYLFIIIVFDFFGRMFDGFEKRKNVDEFSIILESLQLLLDKKRVILTQKIQRGKGSHQMIKRFKRSLTNNSKFVFNSIKNERIQNGLNVFAV